MIFGKDYDNALWYIVNSDRNGKKQLVDFIKELPEEMINCVSTTIKKISDNDYTCDDLQGVYQNKDDPSISYAYLLHGDNSLSIKKYMVDSGNRKDIFRLLIYPLSRDDIKNIRFWNTKCLGETTNYLNSSGDTNDIGNYEYSICYTPFGLCISYLKNSFDNKKTISLRNISNFKNIPNDLKISDMNLNNSNGSKIRIFSRKS